MNIGQMMQQAKEMQAKMEELQGKLNEKEVHGQSGGGMIQVVVTGKGDLKSIKIAPSVVDASDVEMLEDLIVAAVNDGKSRADETIQEETQKLMADMGVPAGLMDGGGMPF